MIGLADDIHRLNEDVTRVRQYWRSEIFHVVTLALANGEYAAGEGSLDKLATTFDGWAEIFGALAMRCYDLRDELREAEHAT